MFKKSLKSIFGVFKRISSKNNAQVNEKTENNDNTSIMTTINSSMNTDNLSSVNNNTNESLRLLDIEPNPVYLTDNDNLYRLVEKQFDKQIVGPSGRFTRDNWFYTGKAPVQCPECGFDLHAYRKKYETTKGIYYYWGLVCLNCQKAFAPNRLTHEERKVLYDNSEHKPSMHDKINPYSIDKSISSKVDTTVISDSTNNPNYETYLHRDELGDKLFECHSKDCMKLLEQPFIRKCNISMFSENEQDLLEEYGTYFMALFNAEIKPINNVQEKFVKTSKMKALDSCETEFEVAFVKYLMRLDIENDPKHKKAMNVETSKRDTWCDRGDLKKMYPDRNMH